MNIKNLKEELIRCESCKGKPDYIYWNSDSGDVLSIICQNCRDCVEATIKNIGNKCQQEIQGLNQRLALAGGNVF